MAEVRKRLAAWETELSHLLGIEAGDETKWLIRCYESVGSTMDVAKETFAELSEDKIAFILTQNQTSGRGRQGRTWNAVDEGFYGTFAFKTEGEAVSLSGLSLAVGCVLCDTLKAYTTEIGLKWPNDVLTKDGNKLCGVLIELSPAPDGQFVLIGVGINLVGSPEELPESASLFDLCGKVIPPVEIAGVLSRNLREAWDQFKQNGFAEFRQRWMEDALFFGKEFSVQVADSPVAGTFLGVDESGSLLLETSAGTIPVSAGHIISID